MIVAGLSWIVFWLLINVFNVALDKAALTTGLIFLILGLLVEGVPTWRK